MAPNIALGRGKIRSFSLYDLGLFDFPGSMLSQFVRSHANPVFWRFDLPTCPGAPGTLWLVCRFRDARYHYHGTQASKSGNLQAGRPGDLFRNGRGGKTREGRSDAFGGYHSGDSGEIARDADVGPTAFGV